MGNCHTVGPNEALVISGGCCGNQGPWFDFSFDFLTSKVLKPKKAKNIWSVDVAGHGA